MGELIRNVKEIKLGNEDLMIELNEGYNKRQGRLIHIQNKKFRFLQKEKDFIELATTVIRAKEEMDYYKESQAARFENMEVVPEKETFVSADEAAAYCAELFAKNNIDYRLIESGNGFATFIVNNSCYQAYKSVVGSDSKLKKRIHMYGDLMGYKFLYQMRPFELFSFGDIYVEVFFQLPCMSLTPNMWIPLDRCVQTRVWDNKDEKDGIVNVDEIAFYIYRLGWAVFCKKHVTEHDKNVLKAHSDVLGREEFRDCMKMVFFNYTDTLIEKLKVEDFDSIIPDYYRFREY